MHYQLCSLWMFFVYRGMAKHMAGYLSKIVSCLIPSLASLYEPQRVVTAAFLAEVKLIK